MKKMKKMKRIFAFALAMVMMLAMNVTVFAADDVVGNSDDRGTITVKGIEETDATVMAYPLVEALYDDNGNFSGYSNEYKLADIEAPTFAEITAIKLDGIEGTKLSYDAQTNAYFADNMAVGMYLVEVSQVEATKYSRAVVSINYVNENGKNVIKPSDLTMSTKAVDGNAWVKKTVEVIVDKVVTNEDIHSANIGDMVNYAVSIDPIPSYSGDYPVLNVVDTLSAGLTYNKDLKVVVGENTLTPDADYTVSFNEETNQITVDFVLEDGYTLNDYAGQKAVISYSAELNENAALDGVANGNDVVLNYTKDSTVNGDDDSDDSKTYTYTFSIDGNVTGEVLKKVDQNNEALAGATFTLYTDEACETVYTNDVFEGTATSDSEGKLAITGLAEGTYYLLETEAPEGYSVNTHVFVIEISAEYAQDGQMTSFSITIDGEKTASFTVANNSVVNSDVHTVDIINTTLSALPATGGIGTMIFTVAGCVIMVVAAGLFFVSRRKNSR